MKLYSLLIATVLTSSSLIANPVRFSDYEPLPQDERNAYEVEDLQAMEQAELDLLYSRLASGPFPVGAYQGTVKFDNTDENDIERILSILSPKGGLEGQLKKLGVGIWKGKVFFPETDSLTNMIGPFTRFPAHVFCGQSLLDARKESIVLDYNYADTADRYNPLIDWLMTRKGLGIRDEIRMVRPGLYLGRAYIHNLFALNFILSKDDLVAAEDSWSNSCKAL